MSVDTKQLTDLEEKIDSTWQLLAIDDQSAELAALEAEMQQADFWNDSDNAATVSKKHEELRSEIETWTNMKEEVAELLQLAEELATAPDEEMTNEINVRSKIIAEQFIKLEFFLLFSGKHDKSSAILTITAGSGGTEAQDWAQMLERMYLRYIEKKGWKAEILEETDGQEAGIKSATIRVVGRYAYGNLKGEHGTHRLVRISPFDGDAMRHTSFAGVEIIPEIAERDALKIAEKDLRIDTFMSSGKGGQSVNTTYSAIRIVHLPTGITVQCQNEKSQLQNKKMAMQVLQSRLQKVEDEKEEAERLKLRGEYKSAEWGNQIRNYVLHPYKMVKDVRTRHETKDPDDVLDGNLDHFVEEYLKWDKEGQPDRKKIVNNMKKIPQDNIDISAVIDLLEKSKTIVYPTETCYGLGCDATNQEAVDKLFKIKERQQDKTVLIVMPDREMAEEYVVWNEQINDLADKYWPGPLTIVAEAKPGTNLAHGVLAEDGTIAFRISSHPLVYEISASLGRPLVSTSANVGGQDSPYDILAIETMFEGKAAQPDVVIDGGDLPEQSPSTIARVRDGKVTVLRQGEIIIDL